jgi:hypothetical protein
VNHVSDSIAATTARLLRSEWYGKSNNLLPCECSQCPPRFCRACRPTPRRHFSAQPIGKAVRLKSWRLPRCSAGGALHPPSVLAWSAVCAPRTGGAWCSTGGTGSAGEAGRSRAPERWGCPRRGSEHVTIVLASAPGYRTCPIPASARLPPTKAGGKERVLKGARILIGGNQKMDNPSTGGWVQRQAILKTRGAHSARRGSPRVPRRQCPQASPTSRADLHK